jgi:hypothetical protein
MRGQAELGPKHWGVDMTEDRTGARTATALLVEKIPLLVLALGFSLFTYAATQNGGLLEYYGRVGLMDRLVNSVCSHAWYMAKTLWPSGLAGLYVHPNLPGGTPWEPWQVGGAVLLLGGVSWAVWRLRRLYLVTGWLWFIGTLLPVNGLVQYANLGRANRYMYMPMIGLLIMLVWGIGELSEYSKTGRNELIKKLLGIGAGGVVLLLALVCYIEVGYWRNDKTFFEHQITLVPNNPYYNINLAIVCHRSGEYPRAIHYAQKGLAIWPRIYEGHEALAEIYACIGNTKLARYHREKGAELRAEAQRDHARSIAQSAFAARISRLLGTP